MITVDLSTRAARPVDTEISKEEIFLLGVTLARATPQVCVRVAVGPKAGDRAILDGRMLAQEGIEVY